MHLKPALKWLVTLTLIVVTLSAFVLASTQASLQQTPSEKTHDLFSLFQNANDTVSSVFRQLEANGETVPQASLDKYNQALVLAEESESLSQEGNYSEANEKIISAFQKLKEALTIVDAAFPWQQTETEISLERTVQLRSAISRYCEQLERIENITCFAASAGYNTTLLEDRIQTIKNLLEKATNNVEQKRFEAAAENLAEAKTLSVRILNIVNDIAVDLKIQRIAAYINKTQERLDTIKETAEALSNEASLAAVNNAETSLEKAKEYLEDQLINETLTELANSKVSEDEAVEYLTPIASSVDTSSNKASVASP
ncbi:hypothetical protein JW988_09010 [Candidatus Bathyarchaeota archaeon]|nr:hypothetical protein [Candidatus Bathyarchaeota archaeon]